MADEAEAEQLVETGTGGADEVFDFVGEVEAEVVDALGGVGLVDGRAVEDCVFLAQEHEVVFEEGEVERRALVPVHQHHDAHPPPQLALLEQQRVDHHRAGHLQADARLLPLVHAREQVLQVLRLPRRAVPRVPGRPGQAWVQRGLRAALTAVCRVWAGRAVEAFQAVEDAVDALAVFFEALLLLDVLVDEEDRDVVRAPEEQAVLDADVVEDVLRGEVDVCPVVLRDLLVVLADARLSTGAQRAHGVPVLEDVHLEHLLHVLVVREGAFRDEQVVRVEAYFYEAREERVDHRVHEQEVLGDPRLPAAASA